MKLYGHPGSICTNRVAFVLAEKSVEPEFVVVDLAKGEHKLPAHLARHPFGMLPALEDGDVSLYESRAIMRYLDNKLPGTPLTPRDLVSRAAMEQWISVEESYASPPVGEIVRQKFLVPAQGGTIDVDALDRATRGISSALDVVGKTLDSHPYLAGETFSLADLSLAPVVMMLFVSGNGSLVLKRRSVSAWWDRVSARPAWQRVVAGPVRTESPGDTA
jgi:glutathione S-transferase